MPTLTSVNEFLDVLRRSQLLKDSVLQQVVEQASAAGHDKCSAEQLAKLLVRRQIVTLYQAQRLMAGMSEGFYLGKYKLLDLLGRGGMGKVYLAEQITMGRLVALKVIAKFAKNRSDSVARFSREAKAVAALRHTNIIQAYDYDELDGVPFISMEYVEGIDVGDHVDKFGPLGFAQAADYVMQAALGLEAAHKAGFVHRDVKPGNLLVDREGVVKVLDLGLAVSNEQRGNGSLTTAFDQIGTVDYMAPEQAVDSHNVDIRADIYALGGVLYALTTAQLPCPGKSSAEKLLKHQQTPPRPIRELVPAMPEKLAKLIHKMLEKNRDVRPQTPAEVAEALRPFAQRKTPPYDVSVIRNSRESLASVLGRSPDPNEINVRSQLAGVISPTRSGNSSGSRVSGDSNESQSNAGSQRSPTQAGTKANASTVSSQARSTSGARSNGGSNSKVSETVMASSTAEAVPTTSSENGLIRRQPSGVATKGPSSNIGGLAKTRMIKKSAQSTILVIPDEEPLPEDDFLAELPQAPSIRRLKKKKTSKSGKMAPAMKLVIGIGSAVMLCVMTVLGWDMLSSGSPETAAAAAAPATSSPLAARTSVVLPPASYDAWLTFSNQFKSDPDLVFYYTFSGEGDGGDIVRSQASQPKYGPMNAKVFAGDWTAGRFPQKKGLKFNGNASGQYVLLSDNDSNLCNFTTSFTVGTWFKAGVTKGVFQVLASKGDDSWRLQRWQGTEKLELAANNTPWDPVTKKHDPSKGKMTQVMNFSSIDDNKWHFAVGVYELQGPKKTLQIFFDGQPEGIVALDHMQTSKHPVCIGANGDRLRQPDPRIWNGLIDEVFVINRALTVDDIARMYAAGRPAE